MFIALATEPGQRRYFLLHRAFSFVLFIGSATIYIQVGVFGAASAIWRGRGGLVAEAPVLWLHGYLWEPFQQTRGGGLLQL